MNIMEVTNYHKTLLRAYFLFLYSRHFRPMDKQFWDLMECTDIGHHKYKVDFVNHTAQSRLIILSRYDLLFEWLFVDAQVS